MKNFTNNFKQFTTHLSARWLIMALMLLVGTSSAWGGVQFTNDYIFLDLSSSVSEWEKDGAVFQVSLNEWDHCGNGWDNSKLSKKYDLIETSEGSHIYYANVSDDTKNRYGAYFYRCDPNNKTTVWNTACIGYNNSSHNCFKVNGWTSSTSTYNLTDVYCISAPTFGEVEVGQSATSSGTYLYAGVSTIPEISNNSTEFQYVAGSSSITTNGSSTITVKFTPSSAGDKTGTLKFGSYLTTSLSGKGKVSCIPSATLSSAVYDAVNNEIDLSGSIETCDNNLFYGFLWKNKEDANWNTANAISGTGGNNNNTTEDIDFNQSWDDFTPGDTYEFTAYALDATTNPYTWYYSTNENDVIEVSTCTSIPDNTYAIAGNNEWTGNANPVTINYDANTYGTPTILYDGEAQIPTDVGTYAITINVPVHNGYCASTISLGDYEITCIDVEKPDITTSATTVCEGTPVTLSNYNGVNTNTVTVKWYSNSECTSEVTQQVTPTNNKVYYAKAYHEASGCYSSAYSTLTFTVNPKPTITITGNNSAVLYEDVELTAATDGTSISWEITEGDGSLSSTTGNSVTLTSSSADNVTVTATATLGSCTATDTHEVEFSAENCEDVLVYDNEKVEIWLSSTLNTTMYLHRWYENGNSDTGITTWPGASTTKSDGYYKWITTSSGNIGYIFHDNTNNNKSSDANRTMEKGYRYYFTFNGGTGSATFNKSERITTTESAPISAPAAKTISVSTTDGEGNIIFSGQVVKTGCDATNEYGFQYSSDEQTWTTVKVGENAAAGTAISNNTVNGLDGTYYVRAYITNDNSTQYGAIKEITVSTEKDPITTVTLTHVKDVNGTAYSDQELENLIYCAGETVWFKLEQDGSKFQDYQWISYPGTDLVGMYAAGTFSLTITDSGNVGIRLKNDANDDWVESNLLEFKTHPEPTAPYISINPASGVICQGSSATITVENPSIDCSYKLVEDADFTPYTSGDLTYTVQDVAKYYVVAQHKACTNNEYTSNQVAINQIIRTNATISIDPDDPETTPWEPVTITVNPQEGYVYELSYTNNDLAGVAGVIIKQNGDSYTYYIPRPDSWGTGDATPVRATVNYGIKAQLKVDGETSQCDLNYATATIQLKDEDNENCPQ